MFTQKKLPKQEIRADLDTASPSNTVEGGDETHNLRSGVVSFCRGPQVPKSLLQLCCCP